MVGTSGSVSQRAAVVTPSARSLPVRTYSSDAATVLKVACTWPLTASVKAGASPRYGTWITVIPAISLNSSCARWLVEPTPKDATLTFAGLVLACAMNSATDLVGNDGVTSRTSAPRATQAIGMMSRCRLNKSESYSVALLALVLVRDTSV